MINRADAYREERRPIADGVGDITLRHRFEREDMFGKARLCAELIVEPGHSIGEHAHGPDAEIFYMLEGSLTSVREDGSSESFETGDAMITGGGAKHCLRNDGDVAARMLAIVML